MTWEAWASVLIMLASVVAMARGLAGPDLVLTAAMGLLLALGILSPAEAAKGFGNEGMLSVGVMKVIWTRHAEERQKEWEKKRGITRQEVEALVMEPTRIVPGDRGVSVAQG